MSASTIPGQNSANASSLFDPPEDGREVPSYQEDQIGPWGTTLNGQVSKTATLNIPFDQLQYENAVQNGCIPPTCNQPPRWPPPPGTGFIYPSLEKEEQNNAMGDNLGCFPMAAPFVSETPVLPSSVLPRWNARVPHDQPQDTINGKQYSPQSILNMYECMSTPQPNSAQCFGYMPYDASYKSSSMGQTARYDGFLDNPLSPVPISSPTQPLGVGVNVPSDSLSDRNPWRDKYVPSPQKYPIVLEQFPEAANNNKKKVPDNNNNNNDFSNSNSNCNLNNNDIFIISQRDNSSNVTRENFTNNNNNNNNNTNNNNNNNNNNNSEDSQCSLSPVNLIPCMIKSLNGFFHDLLNFNSSDNNNNNNNDKWETLNKILTKNNRQYYLVSFIIIIFIIHFTIDFVCQISGTPGHICSNILQFFWISLLMFLIYLIIINYNATTDSNSKSNSNPNPEIQCRLRKNEIQIMICLFVIGIVIYYVINK